MIPITYTKNYRLREYLPLESLGSFSLVDSSLLVDDINRTIPLPETNRFTLAVMLRDAPLYGFQNKVRQFAAAEQCI